MPKLSEYPELTSLTGPELIPLLSTGNKLVTFGNFASSLIATESLLQNVVTSGRKGIFTGATELTDSFCATLFNAKAFGAVGNGTADDEPSLTDALTAIPANAVWSDPRAVEGGLLYLPQGKYKINTKLTIGNGLGNGKRQYVHIKGAGMGRTIIYSDTLAEMISCDTSCENLEISDLSIICYASFTGAGTLQKVLSIANCVSLKLNRVHIYVRTPGANNPDCVLIHTNNCYYSSIVDCVTTTFVSSVAERHNVNLAAMSVSKLGGTHIRSYQDNALTIMNHNFINPFRGLHAIDNDTGLVVTDSWIESYTQGFLLEKCVGCTFKNIRFETHPESYLQYEGDGLQYSVLCDEYSRRNVFTGSNYEVQSDVSNFGFLDYNGSNTFDFNNAPKPQAGKPLLRNGDFALGYYTSASLLYLPGFTVNGAPVMANELVDLPPEAGLTRAISLTCSSNTQGIRAAFQMDPERIPGISFKYWAKRKSGNYSLRPMLYDQGAANYIQTNMLVGRGAVMTYGKTGLPITGTPTWAASNLTIVAAVKHFLRVGQRVTLSAGFTNSGTALANTTYTVASITNAYTFVLGSVPDPGTITAVGTWARVGFEDVLDPTKWQLFTGHYTMRRGIVAVDLSGANAVITTDTNHNVIAGATFKIFGSSNANFNVNTHVAISVTATTITFAKPAGTLSQTGHGTSLGTAFYGWVGAYGTGRFIIGSDYGVGATTGEHLLAGVVLAPTDRSGEITNNYLPGVVKLVAQVTYDPGSINANSTIATPKTVTVTGAAVGDAVSVGFSQANNAILWSAQVTSADTVTVQMYNTSGSAVDMASGLLTVTVEHVSP